MNLKKERILIHLQAQGANVHAFKYVSVYKS